MTVAYKNTGNPPAPLRPVTHTQQLHDWREELDYWKKETTFYLKLLQIGIHNSSSPNRPLVYSLQEGFIEYKEAILPGMNSALGAIAGTEQLDAMLAFQKELEMHRQELRQLKTQFFPLLIELRLLGIW